MAVGRSSHSKWLCSCSLSLPCPTSAYFTYTLLAGLTSPPPCPTAQLTIAYQTADEESTPQVVSTINRFCATVGLGAHAHGFLSAHACLCGHPRACVGARVRAWVRVYVCACVHVCVRAWLRGCVRGAWLRAWPPACVGGCLSACVHGRLCMWVPACLHACKFSHISVFDCSLPGILQPSIAIFFSMASARQGSPEVNSYTIGNPGFPQQ